MSNLELKWAVAMVQSCQGLGEKLMTYLKELRNGKTGEMLSTGKDAQMGIVTQEQDWCDAPDVRKLMPVCEQHGGSVGEKSSPDNRNTEAWENRALLHPCSRIALGRCELRG